MPAGSKPRLENTISLTIVSPGPPNSGPLMLCAKRSTPAASGAAVEPLLFVSSVSAITFASSTTASRYQAPLEGASTEVVASCTSVESAPTLIGPCGEGVSSRSDPSTTVSAER